MCGINGIVAADSSAPPVEERELSAVREAMAARGPDGAGLWVSPDRQAGLAHRRLAILDLSEAGAQPMLSADGRYVAVLNGEIYNFRQIRRDLEAAGDGAPWRSSSDTEVLLRAYARWGIPALPRLRGMFAFAIWDSRERALLLARDAAGIKPLYYSFDGAALRFASQVTALLRGKIAPGSPEPAALCGFLMWGAVPEPLTLHRAIRAVPAGHVVEMKDGSLSSPRPFGTPRAASLALPRAVAASIEAHLVSDVPVGVFLSSGMDSAMIAAVAARALPEPPAALTLVFSELEGTEEDEGPLAAEIARALGLRHVVRTVTRRQFLDLLEPELAAMDQPSVDGFNTFAISRLAHDEGMKVVLSGLGGDELFGSYSSFSDVPRWRRLSRLLSRVPVMPHAWPALARMIRPRQKKLAGLVAHGGTVGGAYFLRRGLFLPEELPAILGEELAREGLAAYDAVREAQRLVENDAALADPWFAVQHLEWSLYMRHQLLRDSDWASMANSVELRVPLADPVLLAQAAMESFEPARSQGKAALTREVAPELPAAVFTRRKSGFRIPVARWLSGNGAMTRGEESRYLALHLLARISREQGLDLPVSERSAA